MASKILVFLHLFGPGIPRVSVYEWMIGWCIDTFRLLLSLISNIFWLLFKTSTVLNSWATVSLWRRYFKYEEEKDERQEIEASHESNDDHYYDTVEGSSSAPDLVRSEWARRELSEFRRSTSLSRDYRSQTQHVEEQVQSLNPPNPSPMYTPSAGLDHPDLRVNGMFLPQ